MSDDSSFTEGPDLPEERFLQCATVLPDGRVFTAAGYDGKHAYERKANVDSHDSLNLLSIIPPHVNGFSQGWGSYFENVT